jgi:transposase
MRSGHQREIRTPGKNKKVAVFGAWCYATGRFLHHTQPTKTAWGSRVLIQRLLARSRRTGRQIVLVLDQGSPHHAKFLHRDLELAQPYLQTFWLPHYCWELDLIERLWKHLKGSRMANVLFASFRQFQRHLQAALKDFAQHPDLTLSIVNRKRQNAFTTT